MRKSIGVVGPCSAGKTTLINTVKKYGFNIHHIAQEHSHVQDMWQQLDKPDVLIYLDVTYNVSMKRRPLNMTREDFSDQIKRLEHARQHANLYINTTVLTPEDVLNQVLQYLEGHGILG
jgi:thymidylate kinase